MLNEKELTEAAKAIDETSVKHVELGGGTLWGEEGDQATLKALEAVANVSRLGVWINNGTSFILNVFSRGVQQSSRLQNRRLSPFLCPFSVPYQTRVDRL